jgi:hypothetical protein
MLFTINYDVEITIMGRLQYDKCQSCLLLVELSSVLVPIGLIGFLTYVTHVISILKLESCLCRMDQQI